MKLEAPIFVRTHHDGRVTASVVLSGTRDLIAHADGREAALDLLRDALVEAIEEPGATLVFSLKEPAQRELRRIAVPIRVQRRSGRRAEVTLPLTCILVRPPEPPPAAHGARRRSPEVAVPRLGLWLDLETPDEIEAAVRDEVRRELAGGSDAEVLALVQDEAETLETLEVEADPRERPPRGEDGDDGERGVLGSVGIDLVAEVRRGRGAAAYAREAELRALMEAVTASPPRSALLVGPSGAGKTAIVHELARRIALKEAPASLERARVYYLSGNRIVAGMTYLGDWEERCKEIVDQARERQAILFVDDLAELCEAGRVREGEPGAARFFAPHVARGEVTIVAESTPERLRRVERLDPALLPLLSRIEVREVSPETALEIARRSAGPLGRANGVRLEPSAAAAAVELHRRFVPARRFPGKAVAFLGRLAAAHRRSGRALGREDAIALFAKETGLPEVVIREDVPLERARLAAELAARVIDQPEAVEALADAVLLVKTGLNDPKKPVAVYLFAGPTGVGKTESARALAERLFGDASRLARFDMSEYADPAGHLRLAGGEGWGEGALARKLREQPFCVLLLDEIEKAGEAVFDMLLSALGEGRLVDHGGRVADLRSAIVILTTNLGAGDPGGMGFGLGGRAEGDPAAAAAADEAASARFRRAAEDFFRPELLNRIDRIVPFRSLSRAAIERIARRELDLLVEREGLRRRAIDVTVDPALVGWLARAGFHPRYGARPLQREVERRAIGPLARHLARRSGRTDVAIALWLDGEEVRVAARDRAPRRTFAAEFFDPAGPATAAALAAALSAVRVRLWGARESWIVRDRRDRAGVAALDARARALLDEAAAIEADLAPARLAALDALDAAATALELALLLAAAAPPPLATLSIEGREDAAARVAASLESYAPAARERDAEGRLTLRFADPARAAALAVEAGVHEMPDGARVRVVAAAPAEALVRRRSGGPPPFAEDPRTGLRQPGADPPLERFLLGGWRLREQAL